MLPKPSNILQFRYFVAAKLANRSISRAKILDGHLLPDFVDFEALLLRKWLSFRGRIGKRISDRCVIRSSCPLWQPLYWKHLDLFRCLATIYANVTHKTRTQNAKAQPRLKIWRGPNTLLSWSPASLKLEESCPTGPHRVASSTTTRKICRTKC